MLAYERTPILFLGVTSFPRTILVPVRLHIGVQNQDEHTFVMSTLTLSKSASPSTRAHCNAQVRATRARGSHQVPLKTMEGNSTVDVLHMTDPPELTRANLSIGLMSIKSKVHWNMRQALLEI